MDDSNPEPRTPNLLTLQLPAGKFEGGLGRVEVAGQTFLLDLRQEFADDRAGFEVEFANQIVAAQQGRGVQGGTIGLIVVGDQFGDEIPEGMVSGRRGFALAAAVGQGVKKDVHTPGVAAVEKAVDGLGTQRQTAVGAEKIEGPDVQPDDGFGLLGFTA